MSFPGVFVDADRRTCLLTWVDESAVEFLQMGAGGLEINSAPRAAFEGAWSPAAFPTQDALDRYWSFASGRTDNHARALAVLNVFRGAKDGASETGFSCFQPTQTKEDRPMNTQDSTVLETPAGAPTDAAETDPAYAVHVVGQRVTVEMGKPRDRRIEPEQFNERAQTVTPGSAEPLFYVGLDEKGVMVRCTSFTLADRKVIGALTGGWVAEGLTVSKASLKELSRYVAAARKIFEVKEVKPVEGAEQQDAQQQSAAVEPSAAPAE